MNISKRQKGDLNAIITIEVKPEDYQPRVDQTINNYRKNANIPGFRPGHVPAGIIKKKYGKDVLVEELNKLLGEELVNYLRDNNIDVLGTPLPINSNEQLTFEDGKDYSFDYEIGIAPAVTVTMPADKMVENDVDDMRRKYGKFSNPETAEETSVLYGDFSELDENGEVKADGNKTTTTLSIEMIRNDEERKKFIGAKKEDAVRFNPIAALKNETEVSAMLKLEKNSASMNSDYEYKIKTVNKIEKAELNQEFFDKIFGEGIVNSEEEFRSKIREGIASYFENESDKKLQKDLRNVFLESNNLPLPDDFLKRILKSKQENPVDEHKFEHEYFHVAEDLKWNLIQNKIAADQKLTVTKDEIFDTARVMITQQFAQYGMPAPENDKLNEMVLNYLQKDDSMERIERSMLGHKVFDYLKKNLTLNRVELPYEEFIKKLNEKTAHEIEHHH